MITLQLSLDHPAPQMLRNVRRTHHHVTIDVRRRMEGMSAIVTKATSLPQTADLVKV